MYPLHACINKKSLLTHIWSCVAALVAGSRTAGWVVLRMDPSPERSESRKWSSGTWGEYDWMWLNFELSLYFRINPVTFYFAANKSDVSYLKASCAIPGLSWQPFSVSYKCSCSVGITSRLVARFWHFHSRSALCHRIYIASTSQYLKLVTVLDYTPSSYTPCNSTQSSRPKSKVNSHSNNVCDLTIARDKCRHTHKPTDTWKR